MKLSYERYLDGILGGWIGKSAGGAIGARFEGYKGWIEINPTEMFPDKMPPNDDLDLQVLWLKVLEEKGAALTSDDLAAAWLEGCWYPFNEYGIFRRNWRLGIHPPDSGRFTNQFWETGEGCPIRAEIWGYVFPGAPDLAAKFAAMDGALDHTEQSIGAEMMLAAMSSMAFFIPDVRRLAGMFMHYLPAGTPIELLTRTAFACYDEGLSLRDARDRLMALAGVPEACDAQINIPFTFLGLLYGGNDLQEVMLAALRCGYDTDCTLASAAALVGQILGASRIPESIKTPVGDELVMGIQYNRPEMTLSALARDTARAGVLLAQELTTGIEITDTPPLQPFPATAVLPLRRLKVTCRAQRNNLPVAAPGETVQVVVGVEGAQPDSAPLTIQSPAGWTVVPEQAVIDSLQRQAVFALRAPTAPGAFPMKNLFTARLDSNPPLEYTFGVAGAGLWKFLGVYYDELPDPQVPQQQRRRFNQHFVSLQREYIPEPPPDGDALYESWSRKLGRPALIISYQHEIDLSQLIGLRGPLCAYLSRTVISPEEREVYIVIGNNESFRLYLNGKKIGEQEESTWWAPFNCVYRVRLKQGENHLLVKLLRRSDELRFTLGFRHVQRSLTQSHGHNHNIEDWVVDMADLIG